MRCDICEEARPVRRVNLGISTYACGECLLNSELSAEPKGHSRLAYAETMPHKTDTTLTGAAGEHLVLSRLLQRGLVASQAPEGVRVVDILVNPLEGGRPLFIQVKARQFGADGGWHMSQKHENQSQDDLFYCFVDFEPASPTVHVVPSSVVAAALQEDHRLWLSKPGKGGRPHQDHSMRRLRPAMYSMPEGWMKQYLENWSQLQ